ncbi:hypothetical protein [Cryobacterium sp. Hb1]|uniref:hypothetical protein n=1 Tax=Cryobacterium sp. Hb1 TaxID=1259147 RepID=UPI00106C08FE|nr:hypothetical protein [Cryobacterium sp. Hb1]TFD65594.1 hypothetical protein E3T38_14245 [Cryobacterium sp. Hb1]
MIEVKRGLTPRQVTAQLLDYASWGATLSHEQIISIFAHHRPGVRLTDAFYEQFEITLPDVVNATQVLTIVAPSIDPATERIVKYLADFGLLINVVVIQYLRAGSTTWLVKPGGQLVVEPNSGRHVRAREPLYAERETKTRTPSVTHDWCIHFDEHPDGRQWSDGIEFGFVSTDGSKWFDRSLADVIPGSRIFAFLPGSGYVGVGRVLHAAKRFDEALVRQADRDKLLSTLPLKGTYRREGDEDDDLAEWVIAVKWSLALPREQAFRKPGMNTYAKTLTGMRHRYTIDAVARAFGSHD